jgi:hypothetical protein
VTDERKRMIMGRVVELDDHRQEIVPINSQPHAEATLIYQRHLAALIAAAYFFKSDGSEEALRRLMAAAREM